jgi:hypothetical protein
MLPLNTSGYGRILKAVVTWNIVLTVMFVIAMGLYAASAQAANDPPVKVFTAHLDDVGGGGAVATSDNTINGTAPDQLAIVTTNTLGAGHPHTCLVVASAAAKYAGKGTYVFGLSMDNAAATNVGSERRIEMFDNGGIEDDSWEEVSSTYVYDGVMGSHDFRWSARKSAGADSNLIVDAATLSVVCVKKNIESFPTANDEAE